MNDPSDNLDTHQHFCPTCRLHRWCDELECREITNKVCLDDDPLYKEVPIP